MSCLQSVPAFRYEIKVYEGVMDAIHGGGEIIKEIFFPSHKVVVNSKGGFFHAEKPRNVQSLRFGGPEVEMPLEEIKMPIELVERISLIAKLKLEISTKEKEVELDLKQVWG